MSPLDVRAIDEAGLRNVPCPPARHDYRVFLAEEAFDRAVERGAKDTTREVGGVLVGQLLRDGSGPYLLVDGTIDALHAEEKGAELTFTHATWEHIHKEMDSRPDKRVVGWYHTHPGFGVFLSDRDQFIHKSFFNLPFQVALVYDPKSREHGLFIWHEDEVVRARRYWIGSREQSWDGPRSPGRAAGGDRAEVVGGRAGSASTLPEGGHGGESPLGNMPPASWLSMIATGLILLLAAGFFGHWLGACSARDALGQAQLELAKARADGAQAAIGSLQSDLVGILRATLGDEAVRKPTDAAIGELDRAVQALRPALPAGAAAASPRIDEALLLVTRARDGLQRLRDDRRAAETVLLELELAARRGTDPRGQLARDVAQQRAALGGLYAELAADAVRLRDAARARRLLAAAAAVDPGNHARYQKQLQAIDRSSKLPRQAPAPAPVPAPAPGGGR